MKRCRSLSIIALILLVSTLLSSCSLFSGKQSFDLSNIPNYSGDPYVKINDNKPSFSDGEITTTAYESYSELDFWGRCGVAIACCGKELMPKADEERESINSITPSGWVQAEYDFISGKYLYNRCHLIGWQLTAENANEKNLIAGTRYLNIDGMLPFENMVADYIKETGNHVMYRVTPIYNGNDLLPCGVQMEGYSVEDKGEGICFNVYCYNVQPGVTIDYKSGRSCRAGETLPSVSSNANSPEENIEAYILNTSSKKIHLPDCSSISKLSEDKKEIFDGDISELFKQGYTYCGVCLKDAVVPEIIPNETISASQTQNQTQPKTTPATQTSTKEETKPETTLSTTPETTLATQSSTKEETKPETTIATTPQTTPVTQLSTKEETKPETTPQTTPIVSEDSTYVLNTDSKKIHLSSCYHAQNLSEEKREEFNGNIYELINQGYSCCKTCLKDVETTTSPTCTESADETPDSFIYVLNTNSKKIHYPSCQHAQRISDEYRAEYSGSIEDLLETGYTTCGTCFK